MSTAVESPAPPHTRPNGLQRLAGLVSAPVSTMEDIARRPSWLLPFLLILIGLFLSFWLITPKLDDSAMVEEMLADRGLSAEQIETQLEMTEKMKGITVFISPITLFLLMVLLPAALFWVALLAMGGEGKFKQIWAVTLWAWLPMLIRFLLMPLVLLRRSSYTSLEMQSAVKSNLAFLVDIRERPVLASILGSIDLFTIATLALLVIGYAAASNFSRARAAGVVIALYVVFAAIGAGMAAMFM